jgi:hypothetical protein
MVAVMLVLVQVLTAVLALSNYCDFLTYGNDHHRDTSYPSHGDFLIATNSGKFHYANIHNEPINLMDEIKFIAIALNFLFTK